jgi:hypothetical protein
LVVKIERDLFTTRKFVSIYVLNFGIEEGEIVEGF